MNHTNEIGPLRIRGARETSNFLCNFIANIMLWQATIILLCAPLNVRAFSPTFIAEDNERTNVVTFVIRLFTNMAFFVSSCARKTKNEPGHPNCMYHSIPTASHWT